MSDGEALAKDTAPASTAPKRIIAKLEKPVMAHGDMVSELQFREPTGADIETAGIPVNIDFGADGNPKFVIQAREMSAMMSQLAAVPPSAIKMMSSNDWTAAAWKLTGFFVPRQPT